MTNTLTLFWICRVQIIVSTSSFWGPSLDLSLGLLIVDFHVLMLKCSPWNDLVILQVINAAWDMSVLVASENVFFAAMIRRGDIYLVLPT